MRLCSPSRLAAVVAAALPLAGAVTLLETSADAATTKTVVIKNIAFTPGKLTIAHGGTVRFRFDDGTTNHNVTSVGAKRFKSSATKGSGSYSVRFAKPGVYKYKCTLHIGMTGSVTVK